jgi:CheY-like chemotaxis protein/HPt (histidine-containing phosphotransfer) domain-containing protein
VHLDITENKKLQDDLKNALQLAQGASKAKELFLANMSHEIRTPLNGIIGLVREMGKQELNAKLSSYVNSAKKASDHLLSIINNILDLSKIEAGELNIESRPMHIKNLIYDVYAMMQNQAEEKGITFKVDFQGNVSHTLLGDAARFRQILLNLVGNAIKFTAEGMVGISCKVLPVGKYHQEIHIGVKDTGMGMDDMFMARMFTKFQQEDSSTSRKFGGSGLGLAITKELVELMDGQIVIKSAKGFGTEVQLTFKFPLGAIIEDTLQQGQNPAIQSNRISILLVEDNELNRLVAIQVLIGMQAEVTEAHNGLQAVEMLKKQPFDLILMDLQMPEMDGITATEIIRKQLHVKTPIIALTANAFKSEVDRCMDIGMNDYIVKPFEERTLLDIIKRNLPTSKIEKSTANENPVVSSSIEYNLSALKQLSKGNESFVHRMLQLFVDTMPENINAINSAMEKNEKEQAKMVFHKIKPSLSHLGATTIFEEVKNLEKSDEALMSDTEFWEKGTAIVAYLEVLIALIKTKELS